MKGFTDLEQSKKLAKILPLESADMFLALNGTLPVMSKYIDDGFVTADDTAVPCWSLAALLTLIPKNISRKDKIHYEGQTFIPSFRWEITPTAIYYTDGNNIMDYVSFRYGENNKELIDAVFKMIVWLKENNKL